MTRRVYIPVFYEKGVTENVLQNICAGLEEEGVPFICTEDKGVGAERLGRHAASLSSLEVGIGVSADGDCAICHEKLAHDVPYLIERAANGRRVGQNAARLVKGLPLLHIRKDET